MAVQTSIRPRYETVADVLATLGDIPPERILNHPEPGTATEQDVVDLDDHVDRICELVDGVLVRKPVGLRESLIATALSHALFSYLQRTKLGVVAGADGMLKLSRGLIRIPDVSVILKSSMPGGRLPVGSAPNLAPDVAVEMISEGNTPGEMERKLNEYFAAGTKLVWLIYPKPRKAHVYTSRGDYTVVRDSEELIG